MEQKSIGKFISVLRKANGMTQKELGERLFVSAKTVSRWECDECTPDLNLIPLIAEIFSVTSDELLRGERASAKVGMGEVAAEPTICKKSARQIDRMLNEGFKKYMLSTMIALAFVFVAIVAAMICNLGFTQANLGASIALIFFLFSLLLLVYFAVVSRLPLEGDEWDDKILQHNSKITKEAVHSVIVIFCAMLGICVPLLVAPGQGYGRPLDSWIGEGAAVFVIAMAVVYSVYFLFVRSVLIRKNLILVTEVQEEVYRFCRKQILIFVGICGGIAFAICAVLANLSVLDFEEVYVYSSFEEFKQAVQTDYQLWYEEGYDAPFVEPTADTYGNYPKLEYVVRSEEGVLYEFYYNPDLYYDITDTYSDVNTLEIHVRTCENFKEAVNRQNTVEGILILTLFAVIGGGIATVAVKSVKFNRLLKAKVQE